MRSFDELYNIVHNINDSVGIKEVSEEYFSIWTSYGIYMSDLILIAKKTSSEIIYFGTGCFENDESEHLVIQFNYSVY